MAILWDIHGEHYLEVDGSEWFNRSWPLGMVILWEIGMEYV